MENYKNNNKNSNRQNIFARISKYKHQKLKIKNNIIALNHKIETLKTEFDLEFNKLPSEINYEKYIDLQTQLKHYNQKLSKYKEQEQSLIHVAKNLKKTCIKIGSVIVAGSIAIGGLVSSCSQHNTDNISNESLTSFSDEIKEPEPTTNNIVITETHSQETSKTNYTESLDAIAQNFIDLYAKSNRTPEEQKQLENYSAEIIAKTNYLKSQVFERINEEYRDIDEIYSVKASIFNYDTGSTLPIVSFNNSDSPVMSHNNSDILAGSILDQKYPTNVDLANARIAAYTIQSMDSSTIENVCIVKDSNEKFSYDFDLNNNIQFRASAKKILQNNIELYKYEMDHLID